MAHGEFQPRLKLCNTCWFWSTAKITHPDGYIEAPCNAVEANMSGNVKMTRGSDKCGKWKLNTWKPLQTNAEYNI